ncbi:PDZ domain-containing protein [Azoarcus sp. DN11]|uniref:PDZ domain-containing protein n=1 Tax=Azoarcus sp. DN11 TaxID=356837 RepID=UPI0013E2E3C9|nr:PDZ domain-containing protein [Azoarcus sp. DN11]
MLRPTLIPIIAISVISGCASIVSGQNQSLSVTTPGCPGASCELSNDKGRWYVPTTPATVTVNRSYADLLVRCTKTDHEPAIESVKSGTKGMAFGNIVFGGVIGAGVDIVNGSAYDYPNEISLPMKCAPGDKIATQRAFTLGCRVVELAEARAGLSREAPVREGVVVTAIDRGGPAERAGLQVGDLLFEFDGAGFENSVELKELLSRHDASRAFRIRYWRDGAFGEAELKP